MIRALRPRDPVFCIRPRVIRCAAERFLAAFPGRTLYAVKCNPHPSVIGALYTAGTRHFDAASLPEIAQLRGAHPDAGIYFMHPVKDRYAIRAAYYRFGVRHFAVDHRDELGKVVAEAGADDLFVFVRLRTPESDSLYHLADKFGAEPAEAADLAEEAARRNARVGLTFHVGSQCLEPRAFRAAFDVVAEVIERSHRVPACIDVGGGFPHAYPGRATPQLEEYIAAIADGVRGLKLRSTPPLWAEPGRALVAAGCSLVAQVNLRKGCELYINDGVYGAFSELIDSEHLLPARLLPARGDRGGPLREFVVYGPTCDSMDVLASGLWLPDGVAEGDWIEIGDLGAYSNALSTRFNGFALETFVEVFDDPPGTCPTVASSQP